MPSAAKRVACKQVTDGFGFVHADCFKTLHRVQLTLIIEHASFCGTSGHVFKIGNGPILSSIFLLCFCQYPEVLKLEEELANVRTAAKVK